MPTQAPTLAGQHSAEAGRPAHRRPMLPCKPVSFFFMKKRAIPVLQPLQKTSSFDRLPLLSGFRDRWIKKQRFRGTDHGPAGGYTSENSTGTLQSHRNKTTRASFFLLLLPPFQNISCFDFFIFIYFAMYLDICYI